MGEVVRNRRYKGSWKGVVVETLLSKMLSRTIGLGGNWFDNSILAEFPKAD